MNEQNQTQETHFAPPNPNDLRSTEIPQAMADTILTDEMAAAEQARANAAEVQALHQEHDFGPVADQKRADSINATIDLDEAFAEGTELHRLEQQMLGTIEEERQEAAAQESTTSTPETAATPESRWQKFTRKIGRVALFGK